MVHADLNPSNVLVRDGAVVAVVDIENAGSGTRATDLTTLQWHTFHASLDGSAGGCGRGSSPRSAGTGGGAHGDAGPAPAPVDRQPRARRRRRRGGRARPTRARRAGRARLTVPSAKPQAGCEPSRVAREADEAAARSRSTTVAKITHAHGHQRWPQPALGTRSTMPRPLERSPRRMGLTPGWRRDRAGRGTRRLYEATSGVTRRPFRQPTDLIDRSCRRSVRIDAARRCTFVRVAPPANRRAASIAARGRPSSENRFLDRQASVRCPQRIWQPPQPSSVASKSADPPDVMDPIMATMKDRRAAPRAHLDRTSTSSTQTTAQVSPPFRARRALRGTASCRGFARLALLTLLTPTCGSSTAISAACPEATASTMQWGTTSGCTSGGTTRVRGRELDRCPRLREQLHAGALPLRSTCVDRSPAPVSRGSRRCPAVVACSAHEFLALVSLRRRLNRWTRTCGPRCS